MNYPFKKFNAPSGISFDLLWLKYNIMHISFNMFPYIVMWDSVSHVQPTGCMFDTSVPVDLIKLIIASTQFK